MIVAIDAEAALEEQQLAHTTHLARLLTTIDGVVVLTRPENHAQLETLRDERCDIALVRRPLFEGHVVASWRELLTQQPRLGAELLGEFQREKLRIIGQFGAEAVLFPADAAEAMDIDAPIIACLTGPFERLSVLSAGEADAVLLESQLAAQFLVQHGVSPAKLFVACSASTHSHYQADELIGHDPRLELARVVADACEFALASYQLRKAA